MRLKKKMVFLRLLCLCVVYAVVFAVLVAVQSTKQILPLNLGRGNLTVTSRYNKTDQGEQANGYRLAGDVLVSFKGLEFRLDTKVFPAEYLIAREDSVAVVMADGTQLSFTEGHDKEEPELQIQAGFAGEVAQIELPYRLTRAAEIKNNEDGQLLIVVEGITYRFNQPQTASQTLLILRPGNSIVSYQVVPEVKGFSLADFVIAAAQTPASYTTMLNQWRDQNFPRWNRLIANSNDEELVVTFVGEALRQGVYKTAVEVVPGVFKNGNRRTFESTGYLGRLDLGLRSLVTTERGTLARLTTLLRDASPDIFRESHIVSWFAIRGRADQVTEVATMAREIDPATIDGELIPGIFEGFVDFSQYYPATENPFDALIEPAIALITSRLAAYHNGVLVFVDGRADTEYNLRLGKALMAYTEVAESGLRSIMGVSTWAGIGRSLVLSVLMLGDDAGAVPAQVRIEETEVSAARVSSSRLYHSLDFDGTYPHAVALNIGSGNAWAWTVAPSVVSTWGNNTMDIQVTFPTGETHYMFIRGITRPTRIQVYNQNWPSDPQYERYDSSGWTYSVSEETLLVKMRHRSPVEQIRLYF
jgi:hypothetical protein